MAFDTLPQLEGIDGDVTYPRNFTQTNEYFFQTDVDETYPWEAVGYEDGSLFYECSTMPFRYSSLNDELGKMEVLESLLLEMEPESIREGDHTFVELWYKIKRKEKPQMSLEEVRETYEPPENIDFRMV